MPLAFFRVSINLYEESERWSMIEVVPPFLALKCILCMEADRSKAMIDAIENANPKLIHSAATIEGGCKACAGRPDGER